MLNTKYLTEKNLYILSGLVVIFWLIFDPHWEPVAVFVATCAVIKGIAKAQSSREKDEFTKEFDSFSREIRKSLAYLVGTHLNDQDRDNCKFSESQMWQQHGQGNTDVFIDYIIHSLMPHNSERCIYQVFNIVDTDAMIAAQFVQGIDRFIDMAESHDLEMYVKSTKLYDLYQWLVHPEFKLHRRKASWTCYV